MNNHLENYYYPMTKPSFFLARLVCFLVISFTCSTLYSSEVKTIKLIHPHDEIIHARYVNKVVGAKLDNTGKTDVSKLLNKALKKVFEAGGGTLYLPAGKYRLDKPVFIRAGTALRGDFVKPGSHKVDPTKNTILCAYYGREMDSQADPLILLDGSSLIDGLVIWYPKQKADNVVSYAPTIRHSRKDSRSPLNGASRNIFLVNASIGIQLGKEGKATCIQLMKNIYGTPLDMGIEVWQDADIPRILDVDFSPDYWPAAGLDRSSVNKAALKKHLLAEASGITYHRCDGSELANINVRGYHIGFELLDGHKTDRNTWLDNEGHYINFKITGCTYGVWIQNIKNHGTQFFNSTLAGTRCAVFMDNPMHGKECAMFMGCELDGGEAVLQQRWEGKPNNKFSLMFSACTFKSPIEWTGGNLSIVDCDFDFVGKHLSIGPKTKYVIIADSRFKGTRTINNKAGKRVKISESRDSYIKPPKYVYDVNKISSYKPPVTGTVFVTAGDGETDDVPRIQKVVDKLSRQGGGYVFLSPGFYMIKSQLIIRSNVELRGQIQSWQHSSFISYYAVKDAPKGPVIYVEYGHNAVDSAAIILEDNAGMDGLFFHYPGQTFSEKTKQVLEKYGWLIRMKGDRSYVKHVTPSNPWRFIDVCTFDPKDTYIGYCNGSPLDQGIRVGESENCMLDNVHFNSWYWNTVYFKNKIKRTAKQKGYKLELDNWMKANTKAFIFAGSRNVDVYGTFTFCANQGFKLLPGKKSGKGPSGIIINSGCDWSKFGLYMHANDGLVFANMHFIDVDENDPDRNISSIYVAKDCKDKISLYNLSTWGTSHRAFAMWGTDTSQVDIYNFSYQLYFAQMNDISGGKVRLFNAIRNVPKVPTTLDMGPDASFTMRAGLFPTTLTVKPSQARADLKNTDGDFLAPPRPGVTRSYSFP